MLELHFKQPITFDTSLTMEWLNDGQLVQKYAIEVWQKGKWVRVAQAQAIGKMKIDHFGSLTASRVRLNILFQCRCGAYPGVSVVQYR